MTQWVENPRGGRARGPRAVARAWVEVLVRPRQFFRAAVTPGDQAPGFTFAVAVALVASATYFLFAPAARPVYSGRPYASLLLVVGLLGVVVAPIVLHLAAAVQTVCLLPADDRGGVSETVQVIAYASAPCAFAGLPIPGVALLCGLYGFALLVIGVREVHGVSVPVALATSVPAGVLVFGVAFRGFAGAARLLAVVQVP